MDSASQGDKALINSDWPSAIQHFTQALIQHPRSPAYYIKRSTAYARLKPADGGPNSHVALRDAEIGLLLARDRGRRELILSAQLRRGVALYQLERYGDAGFVFGILKEKMNQNSASAGAGGDDTAGEGNKSEQVLATMASAGAGAGARSSKDRKEQELAMWMLKVQGKLKILAEGDEKAVVTVAEYPSDIHIPTEKELKKQLETPKAGDAVDKSVSEDGKSKGQEKPGDSSNKDGSRIAASTGTTTATSSGPALAPAPAGKVRHEWYQSNDSVVVTLYVKGIAKDSVDVDLKSDSASLQFPLPTGAEYAFTLDPLFAPIDPSTSKVSIMSTKIELVLRKQVPGQKWNALEAVSTDIKLSDRQAAVSGSTPAVTSSSSTPAAATTTSSAPAYPTSSRHGAKDWDKLATTLTQKKKSKSSDSKGKKAAAKEGDKDEDEDAGNESDGAESVDSDYGGGDPVDAFFKKLYANADPDTRRAMIKSYTESQGTALSTNWTEVKKGKVEARPPSDD